MPNVSELQRKREELAYYRTRVANPHLPKGVKQAALNSVRLLERELEIEGKPYNG